MSKNYLKTCFVLLLFIATGCVCSFGATIDLTRTEFFVKENGSGAGTSWTDAMSGEDFAATLPNVKDGTTFYVAAGTYKPMYNPDGSVTSYNSSKTFGINSNVIIKGGYPANATDESSKSDPTINKTIFTGDITGDDIVEIEEASLSRSNFEDNANNLFYINAENITFSLSGVTISNADDYGVFSSFNGTKLVLSDCIFQNNKDGVYTVNADEDIIDIDNSTFLQNDYSIYSVSKNCQVDIKQTKFSRNQYGMTIVGGSCSFDEIEYSYNKGQIELNCDGPASITNSVFENNVGKIKKIGISSFDIKGCSFIDNTTNGYYINVEKGKEGISHFNLTNSVFRNTNSEGLILVSSDNINIDNSEFSGSTQFSIELNDYDYVNISRSYFTDNKKTNFAFTGSENKIEGINTYFYGNTISNNENENGNLFDFNSNANTLVSR